MFENELFKKEMEIIALSKQIELLEKLNTVNGEIITQLHSQISSMSELLKISESMVEDYKKLWGKSLFPLGISQK